MRFVATLLVLLLVTLGALADTVHAPLTASQAAGPATIVAADDADAASRSDGIVEAFDVQGDPDDRAEVMPADAGDLRLPAPPHAWAAAVASRAPAPWLAGPRRPPRPLDA